MIRVQQADFDMGAEVAKLRRANFNIGGICSFVGTVREMSGDKKLSAMTLEHYPGMTEKELTRIEKEAHERWPLEASLIIHRFGKFEPGEQIVLVVTASPHRKAAFEACEYLIDYLKTRATFWKNEDSGDGGQWVDARDEDDQALDKWTKS